MVWAARSKVCAAFEYSLPRCEIWNVIVPSRGSLAPGLGDLEPAQPIAVTCPASSEAIDALLGTKGGSPRVVPDETKLAITNCASRGSARSKTFGAVGHYSLLLVLSSLFVDHPFFSVALHQPVRLSYACILRRSRSAAQLNVGNRRASKRGHGTIRRFMALALKADHFRNGVRLGCARSGEGFAP
jgi:hypothetical protein